MTRQQISSIGMTFITGFVFMTLLLAAGCGTKDPLSPPEPDVIMPLDEGNQWTYIVKSYSPSSPTPSSIAGLVQTAVEKVTIDDEAWWMIRTIYSEGINFDTSFSYMINRSDGLWSRGSETGTPTMMAKYPAQVGDVFSPYSGIEMELVAIDEEVIVPAGSFYCYHYVMSSLASQMEVHYLYRPNLGLIYLSILSVDSYGNLYTAGTYELTGVVLR